MASIDEQILRTAKEIVVKYIEAGRISPSGFSEIFINVYNTVYDVVTKHDIVTKHDVVKQSETVVEKKDAVK